MLTRAQFNHRSRWLQQKFQRPKISVVGGYHHGNLGDMALGYTARYLMAEASSIPAQEIGLQTLYSLKSWPKPSAIIVGGGAIVGAGTIHGIKEHASGDPGRVAFVSVDLIKKDLDSESISFLSNAAALVMRSQEEADLLQELGLKNTKVMPDLVFGGRGMLCRYTQGERQNSVLGINVVPRIAGESLLDNLNKNSRAGKYSKFIRSIADIYLKKGWRILHIPFTPQDQIAAKIVLEDRPVQFFPYSDSPQSVFRNLSSCSCFLPSRYHALIFCMLSGTPSVPFLYASKCYRLIDEYFPGLSLIGARDLKDGVVIEKIITDKIQPIVFDPQTVSEMESMVINCFNASVHPLLGYYQLN